MSDIQPGDVVVCVDDGPNFTGGLPRGIRKGGVYRVRSLERDRHHRRIWVVRLHEVSDEIGVDGFMVKRFRKIEAPKTELSERIKNARPLSKEKERA